MDYPVLVVPGIGNSGPLHWQSIWQAAHPDWQRLVVEDWDYVVCDDWVSAIERQLAANGRETFIVAHSLGCLAAVHWATRYAREIRGALLCGRAGPGITGIPPSSRERIRTPAIGVVAVSHGGRIQHQRSVWQRGPRTRLRNCLGQRTRRSWRTGTSQRRQQLGQLARRVSIAGEDEQRLIRFSTASIPIPACELGSLTDRSCRWWNSSSLSGNGSTYSVFGCRR